MTKFSYCLGYIGTVDGLTKANYTVQKDFYFPASGNGET